MNQNKVSLCSRDRRSDGEGSYAAGRLTRRWARTQSSETHLRIAISNGKSTQNTQRTPIQAKIPPPFDVAPRRSRNNSTTAKAYRTKLGERLEDTMDEVSTKNDAER